jgi:hypothetical protein
LSNKNQITEKEYFFMLLENYRLQLSKDNSTTKRTKKTTREKKEIKIREVKHDIENWEVVKVVKQGENHADVAYLKNKPKQSIQKISKTQYVHLPTGETRDYNLSDKKDNLQSLKKTFKRLIQLIRCNFTSESKNQLFLTLTYAENMQDAKKLYTDYKNFYDRLQYQFQDHNFKYISVAEPQQRGAWHLHVMLKSDKEIWINKKLITSLWGHGATTTARLKSDDVGRYYVAYFTNLEIDSNDKTTYEIKTEGKKQTKKQKKGSRLHFYPKDFKFYRGSKDLERPIIEYQSMSELIKEYGNPVWNKAYEVYYIDENGNEKTTNISHNLHFMKNKKEVAKNG